MKFINYIKNLIHKEALSAKVPARRLISLIPLLGVIIGGLALSSCSMVNEDFPECAPAPQNKVRVNFEYTYNMSAYVHPSGQEQDLFDSQAGSVYLYIFDKDGVYIDREEKHKIDFAKGDDFSMEFGEDRLKPGETYQLVAVAQGNAFGYDDSDEYKWFKLVNPMEIGTSTIKDYILKLDRDTNKDGFGEVGVINYKDQYGQNQQMIDTLWTTKPDEVQIITVPEIPYKPTVKQQPDSITEVKIPMMRITNAITVNIVSDYFDADIDPNDYHIVIHYPNGNGTVDFCGDISPSLQELYYQSLVKFMTPYNPKPTRASNGSYEENGDATTYCLSSKFAVSRMMLNDDSSLQIRNALDEENGYPILAEVPNFTNVLAELCNDTMYDEQEFLDREHDFNIDIKVDANLNVRGIYISCSILAWARRVFDYELH